ncbi:hypothetical protein NDU88_006030 [Pleurodeles waltl]|uniref:Uncharacterized protein n=1 Tax=Pleurodeles waltl TaxID=8319 RepID=A0AAV7ML56_PLEWA|nr:hypothetical protein NDU88_006030 [Pleurodeles waltl]
MSPLQPRHPSGQSRPSSFSARAIMITGLAPARASNRAPSSGRGTGRRLSSLSAQHRYAQQGSAASRQAPSCLHHSTSSDWLKMFRELQAPPERGDYACAIFCLATPPVVLIH